MSTDRNLLEEEEEFEDDFTNLLSNMLHELTEHHFIAKNQNLHLKSLKVSLKPNECITILDFAEHPHTVPKPYGYVLKMAFHIVFQVFFMFPEAETLEQAHSGVIWN